jgi:hypothetical protein
MQIGRLFLVLAIIVSGGTTAVAQMTDPFEALAQSKRQQIELEKRMKRDAAEQKKRENTQKDTQRQQDLATAKAQKAARPTSSTAKPVQPPVREPTPTPLVR